MNNTETKLAALAAEAEAALAPAFANLERVAFSCTKKVLDAFREHRVAVAHFDGTTGYGYDDLGRETLDKIYADVLGTEAAFVRHNIVNGTHALALGLFGLLRPGDTLLSITGRPYDTLEGVIGIGGKEAGNGTLADYGVAYKECDLLHGTTMEELGEMLTDTTIKVVYIQRSKGYLDRPTLMVAQIDEVVDFVHARSNAFVFVDNCYGEFTEEREPRADLLVGSLIKNPGGGMAESGAYLAGTARAVELASYRFTCPGIGLECGATLGQNKNMYKGLFFAPHVVMQAIKTAMFAAYIFERLGYEVEPSWQTPRADIIQAVKLGSREKLCAFCRGIQAASPVDAYVTPEPWAMPGYSDEVIMAAGTFTQGASIELSADGPIRPPYTAFFQGGLTYESGKLGILSAAAEVLATEV